MTDPRADRVVLVTGASSGIGRATAWRSAARGDHLVLVARGARSLEDVAAECRTRGAGSVLVVPTDVGDDAAVERCFAAALAAHPRIDAVVNVAGVVAYGRVDDVPAEVFDGVVRTNLGGSVNVARHALRAMRRQRHGSLVLVGSVIGQVAVPSMSAYAVSKWGVRALARQLQLENRDLPDVHVSYVSPGGVDTPIYEQAATYDGYLGRPPPPVARPDRVAALLQRRIDRPRARTEAAWSNYLLRLGFSVVPGVYDRLVGPLFRVAAIDLTRQVGATAGNVLTSHEDGNRLVGHQGSATRGIARNVRRLLPGSRR